MSDCGPGDVCARFGTAGNPGAPSSPRCAPLPGLQLERLPLARPLRRQGPLAQVLLRAAYAETAAVAVASWRWAWRPVAGIVCMCAARLGRSAVYIPRRRRRSKSPARRRVLRRVDPGLLDAQHAVVRELRAGRGPGTPSRARRPVGDGARRARLAGGKPPGCPLGQRCCACLVEAALPTLAGRMTRSHAESPCSIGVIMRDRTPADACRCGVTMRDRTRDARRAICPVPIADGQSEVSVALAAVSRRLRA